MIQTDSGISKIMAVMLACVMLCFAGLVQAKPAPSTPPFDHSKTGFLLRDVHTTLRCEQCHVDGIFKNTPKDCAGCHAIGTRVGATPKPVNHVQTTQPCDTCHESPTSFLVKNFKHIGITGRCITCHNAQSAGVVSKPANHFPTLLPCESCHTNTNTFLSWRMDHTGLTSNCASCHGGQFTGVVGKPLAHIPTTGDCGVCHNTTTFLGSTYDHTTVVAGTCGTCHMGQLQGVRSQPAVHVPTLGSGNACDVCHTATNTVGYTSFLGAMYNHTTPASAGMCSLCHTGQFTGVQGKPSFHIPTASQCDTCHTSTNTSNFTTFYGATFNHVAVVAGSCGTCHNNVAALGKPATHIITSAACDSCHTNTAGYTTWLGAVYTHSPNPPIPGSCGTCHNGATALGKPAWHMVTTAVCDACHTQANTNNFTTFLGATGAVDHAALTPPAAGSCQRAGCHDGVGAKGLSTGHIPVAGLSCDSGGCHKVFGGAVTSFAGAVMSHAVVTATRCDVCHNGSYTTQGTMGAQAKVSNHIPTTITGALDCTTCHTAPTYTSPTGWLQERMNHNGAQGAGGGGVYCVNCHLRGVTYLGSMQKLSHNGASVAKDCSSTSCHRPLGRKGTPYSAWN